MVCKYCYAENADVFVGITAQSTAYLDYEKYIHRTLYPYIIHPHSRFRVYWEIFLIIHIISRLTIVCIIWATFYHKNLMYQIIILVFQVVNIADVVLMFFTGYVEYSTNIVVLEPKKIAFRYLTRFFVFDLIAILPVDFFAFATERMETEEQSFDGSSLYSPAPFLCSLARFPVFTLYLINLSRIFLWDHLKLGMIFIWVIMYVTVLLASNFYLSHLQVPHTRIITPTGDLKGQTISRSERLTTYLDTLILIILDCLFFDIKFPEPNVVIKSLILNLTFLGSALFTTYFINYVIMCMKNNEPFLNVEAQARTFVTINHFSSSLRNKTFLYFYILLQNKYTRYDEVFNYIPDTFKGHVFYHLCLPLLKNFYCFEELPTFVLRRLAESMNYQLYLPNELVMSKEEPILRMYFVQRGTVALFSSKGFELYHFEAGSNFNGKSFILGELVNTNYAISIEVTEVYHMNHNDFLNIMADFPQVYQSINEKVMKNRRNSSYLIDLE